VPEDRFGSFVAAIPPPLGIGNAVLDGGETVKGFICEPYAIAGAREITEFGGWRKYLESRR
jgi:allophanate hydrolase